MQYKERGDFRMRIEQQAGRAETDAVQAQKIKIEKNAAPAGDETVFRVDKSRKADHMAQPPIYGKPEKEGAATMEDVQQQASVMDAKQRKNEMLFVSNRTSQKDAARMEKDGYSLTDSDLHTVVTETDKMKMMLARAGEDITYFGDDLSQEQLVEIMGSQALAQQMEQALETADIPATEDNIAALEETFAMMAELTDPAEATIKYMLENELAVNTENLYRAQFSGSAVYPAPADMDYRELDKQIEAVIKESGLPVTEETMQWGQWMVGQQIPLTAEHMQMMQELSELKLPMEADKLMQYVTEAMAEGIRPGQAPLAQDGLQRQAQEVMDVIDSVGDEELAYLAVHEKEVTVSNLQEAREELDREGNRAVYSNTGLDLLKAHRQLEETRLLMTTEANRALLKQGISIDTMPLEELVDSLKEQERTYYERLLAQDGTPAAPGQAELYAQTSRTVEELQTMPAYAMGIRQADETTLQELHAAGRAQQERMDAAGERYETMMTAPRSDMGDTIQKAFRNVDDILRDMGQDISEGSRRAVRILAYNQIEITEEHLTQVKAMDEEVQRAFSNLKPSVVRAMIREGMNPLDMSLSEINEISYQIQEEQGITEEEKFSKYLYKLEQNSQISEEERSAYIGIYRLIRQVEKTDGAAIGALWQQGGDITMRNLLTQVRSGRHASMDYAVDDEFGGMESSENTGTSITDQIAVGFQQNKVHDVMEYLEPERMTDIMKEDAWLDMTPEELAQQLAQSEVKQEEEYGYARTQIQLLQEAAEAPEEVYRWLQQLDMPVTVQNVLAAAEYTRNRNGIFRQIFEQSRDMGEFSRELAQAEEQIMEAFGEAVKTPEEMAEAQEKLAETAENVMKTMLTEAEDVTSLDVRKMRLLSGQIALGTAAAAREQYAVPVLVKGETCNISLKIVRGEKQKGFVDIVFESDLLGKVAAELAPDQDGIKGYIAASSEETVKMLQEHEAVLREAFGGESTENWNVGFVFSEQLDIDQFGSEHTGQVVTGNEDPVQTRTLYRMAESFIRMVKTMEG